MFSLLLQGVLLRRSGQSVTPHSVNLGPFFGGRR